VQRFVAPHKTPLFASLQGVVSINNGRVDYFLPLKELPPERARLLRHPSADPLTKEEIAQTVSKWSPCSALGADGVSYSVWKKVHSPTPEILLYLLSPNLSLGYHHPSLKKANRVILDKSGKPP